MSWRHMTPYIAICEPGNEGVPQTTPCVDGTRQQVFVSKIYGRIREEF